MLDYLMNINIIKLPEKSGGIAQLGERYNGIVEVIGSIPFTSILSEGNLLKQHRFPFVPFLDVKNFIGVLA